MSVSPEAVHDSRSEAGLLVEEMTPGNCLHLANSVLCRLLGYSENELLSLTSEDLTHPDDRPREAMLAQKMLLGEQDSYELEKRYLHRNGSPVWVAVTCSAARANGGAVLYRVSIIQDISDRKWAEEHFGLLAEAMPIGLVLADQDGKIVLVNSQTEKIFGYRREELLGRSIEVLVPETFRKVHTELRRGFAAEPQIRDLGVGRDLYGRHKDGAIVPVEIGLNPIRAREAIWTLSSIVTIGHRKWLEKALEQSEEKFSKAFRQSPMALTLTSAKDHRYIDINNTFVEITGWKRDEVIGRTPFDIGIWVDQGQRRDLIRRLLSGGVVRNLELRFRTKNGEVRTGLGSAELIEISGEPCALSVIADITDLKRAEEDRLQLAAIVASSDDAIISKSLQGVISSWNSGAHRIFGYTEAEAVGQPITLIIPKELHNEEDEILRRLTAGERIDHYDTLRVSKDGKRINVSVTISPLRDLAGSIIGASSIARDITERKLAEEALSNLGGRLIEAQEEERRRIARELHDDVSQKLAMLTIGLQELAMITPESQAQLRTRIGSLLKSSSQMINDVHALSHRLHTSKLELMGLAETMRSYCRELAEQRHVEIDFTHSDVPKFLPSQVSLCLYRILQEGLGNAVKHSGVRHFEVRLERVADELQLAIRDPGVGFDPSMVSNSQGLGLISMRERINLVKGTLSIESKPGGGTQIKVRVPIAAQTGAD
jgi:PAS domain S-box-containing protein